MPADLGPLFADRIEELGDAPPAVEVQEKLPGPGFLPGSRQRLVVHPQVECQGVQFLQAEVLDQQIEQPWQIVARSHERLLSLSALSTFFRIGASDAIIAKEDSFCKRNYFTVNLYSTTSVFFPSEPVA